MKNIKSIMALTFAAILSFQSAYGMENSGSMNLVVQFMLKNMKECLKEKSSEYSKNVLKYCLKDSKSIITTLYLIGPYLPYFGINLKRLSWVISKMGPKQETIEIFGEKIIAPGSKKPINLQMASLLRDPSVNATINFLQQPLFRYATAGLFSLYFVYWLGTEEHAKKIEKKLDDIENKLDINTNTLLTLDTKTNIINNNIVDIKEDTKNIKTNIVDITIKQTTIGEDVKSIKTNLVKIGEKQNEHTDDLNKIKLKQTTLQELIEKGNKLIEQVQQEAITKEEFKILKDQGKNIYIELQNQQKQLKQLFEENKISKVQYLQQKTILENQIKNIDSTMFSVKKELDKQNKIITNIEKSTQKKPFNKKKEERDLLKKQLELVEFIEEGVPSNMFINDYNKLKEKFDILDEEIREKEDDILFKSEFRYHTKEQQKHNDNVENKQTIIIQNQNNEYEENELFRKMFNDFNQIYKKN